jgi:BirA family biotin operon repressor/biotin-[acetyl-CoA-carboxylase] ligase
VQVLLARGIKNVKVKWPNDIYVGDRKIAGILTDTVLKKSEVSSAIVGVGLNLNQLIFNTPKATSLAAITGIEWDLVVILHDIYQRFYYTLEMSNSDLLESINKLLYKNGENVTFRDGERTLVYTVRAITNLGDLLVENQSGEEKILQHHKIKWIG